MLIPISDIRKVKIPERAHPTDAGMDFFCPEINDELITVMKNNPANNKVKYNNNTIVIPPGENALIPSGIKIEIPYGYMGMFADKSGVASKTDLIIGAKIIDTFYSGEVHIDLHNVGTRDIIIESDMKLAQLIIIPVVHPEPTLVDPESLYYDMRMDKERGSNGFGSTGK